jgi:hypothetical protein
MIEPTISPGLLSLDKLSMNAQQQNLFNDLKSVVQELETHKSSSDHDSRYILASALTQIQQGIYDMVYPVGKVELHSWADLPEDGFWGTHGWLWLDGRTIGDASSNATGLAHANAEALFTKLWTDYADTTAPIYTDAGGASSRGASAAEDWATHKQITLVPDTRGRVLVGMDDYEEGGTAANRITDAWADELGATGGTETHTLTVNQIPSHDHIQNSLTRYDSGSNNRDNGTQASSHTVVGTKTGQTGGDEAHPNVQPSIAVKYIIRY